MKTQFGFIAAIITLVIFWSCRKDVDVIMIGEFTASSVNGFVTNEENTAVGQAKVIINGTVFLTDEFGYFNAENINHDGKIVIQVKGNGYFDGSRTLFTRSNENTFTNIRLIKENYPYKLVSTKGGSIEMEDLVKLEFPPNAIVDKNGNNYSGIVAVGVKYLDPTSQTTYDEMPGALIGQTQNEEEVVLESYGMVGVWLSDLNGNRLNIKPGETCKMTAKIPTSMESYAPDVMPLWHFDESKGVWVEEGKATKIGNLYVGEVSHFSYWNYDYPRPLVYIKGNLVHFGGAPTEGQISISIEGQNGQRISHTNTLGMFEGLVPANEQLKLEVLDHCNERLYSKNIGPFSTDQDLGNVIVGYKNKNITISGRVFKCNGLPAANAIISVFENDRRNDYTADQSGRFSITKQNCHASTFRIKAISIEDEKESKMILLGSSISNIGLIITACDNNVEEYIRITFSNGEKYNVFSNVYRSEYEGIASFWNLEKRSFTLWFDKKPSLNTLVNSTFSFKYENLIYRNIANNGTTIFSNLVDSRDRGNYNEGSFQLSNVTKYNVQLGVEVPLENGLTATGTFRYRND